MCRLLGYCARDHASVTELIGEPGLNAFTALSAWHGDGWGMAAQNGGAIRVAKSPQRAVDDPDYQRLAKEQLGDTGLVHLRWATPGLGVEDRNSHPFTYGEFALAHNGAIHPLDRLPELLPPAWEQRLTGGTDSERYFLHIMSGLDANGGDVIEAIADTVGYISDEYAPNSLNAILLGPGALYAIAWHNPELIPLESIRARNSPEVPELYFDLAYRRTQEALVVASTGWPQDGWTPLPNGSVLVVDRVTLDTRVEPLLPVSQIPVSQARAA
ncbi:MAG: class II glutamine amidotransferase [Streptosporangiaceae bacterium]